MQYGIDVAALDVGMVAASTLISKTGIVPGTPVSETCTSALVAGIVAVAPISETWVIV